MKKIIILAALILSASIFPHKTLAETYHASSAALTPQVETLKQADDLRVGALTKVFHKYNSQLEQYAKAYVQAADKYGVDWRLLPAISGLESSFGKHLMPDSYNAYGWGGGHIYFESWEDGINHITKTLRANYMDKWKAKDVWEIGPIYAESPTWSVRVDHFMTEMNNEYLALAQTKTLTPNLQ